MSIILQFKCKPKNGVIKRPELAPCHVVQGGLFNDLQFKMTMRRLFNGNPELRLPRELRLDDLPEFVTVDQSGFMTVVRIDYRAGTA